MPRQAPFSLCLPFTTPFALIKWTQKRPELRIKTVACGSEEEYLDLLDFTRKLPQKLFLSNGRLELLVCRLAERWVVAGAWTTASNILKGSTLSPACLAKSLFCGYPEYLPSILFPCLSWTTFNRLTINLGKKPDAARFFQAQTRLDEIKPSGFEAASRKWLKTWGSTPYHDSKKNGFLVVSNEGARIVSSQGTPFTCEGDTLEEVIDKLYEFIGSPGSLFGPPVAKPQFMIKGQPPTRPYPWNAL